MALSEDQAISSLTVLTRLAQREQDTEPWIRRAIEGDLERMLGPAVQVAIETGAPMPSVLNAVLRDAEHLSDETLLSLSRRIPPYTSVMRETHALVAERLLHVATVTGAEEPSGLLCTYAERLLETGDAERALVIARRGAEVAEHGADAGALLEALRVQSACELATDDVEQAVRTAERMLEVVDDLNRAGRLLPTQAVKAWYTLGQRCVSAGQSERALQNLTLAAALCAGYLQGSASAQALDDTIPVQRPPRAEEPGTSGVGGADVDDSRLYFAVPSEFNGAVLASLHEALATVSTALAATLTALGRAEEGLPYAVQSLEIFSELAAGSPDAFAVSHANAVLVTRTCADPCPPGPEVDAIRQSIADELPEALRVLSAEAGRRQDLGDLQQFLTGLAAAVLEGGVEDQVRAVDHMVDQGLDHLRADRIAASLVALGMARQLAQRLPPSGEGRAAEGRALNALARAEDRAGLETAAATAEQAVLVTDSIPVTDPLLEARAARQRAAVANGWANRLQAAGRLDEAFVAAQQALDALASVWDPDEPDDVWTMAALAQRLLRLAEEQGKLSEVSQATLLLATQVVEQFAGHRDSTRTVDYLAMASFLTVTEFARRDDSEHAARAQRALRRLAEQHPTHATAVEARTLVTLNALLCHVRTRRLDLAEEALEDLASSSTQRPDDAQATVQLAQCANRLINVYVDLDITAASKVVRLADRALRSPEYLSVLPSLGEDDPPGYLLWLEQIVAAADREATDVVSGDVAPSQLDQ